MKRYGSYKDSGVEWIGEIPSEWECIRLGMLGTFSSSGIDKKSNEDETPVRMVNYTDLIKGRKYYPIQNGQKKYMRVTTPQSKFKEHKLEKGDMVFIPSSETHEDLGYSSLIDFEEDDFVYSYHILRYKTKKPIYHYYKKYLINHHSVLNQFSSECKGTTRKIIGRDVFNNVRVVLPPLTEQQQIVSFLDTKTSLIDSLIEKTQRKIELLKEKRTSLINEVVTKGLNPNVEMQDSGVEWIGEIPIGWEMKKIKFVFQEKKSTKNPGLNSGSISFGVIVYKDDEKILESTKESYQELLKGEFLINPLNLNYDLKSLRIGMSRINVVVSQGYIILILKGGFNPFYFEYLLRRFDVIHIKSLGQGVRQTISFNHIKDEYLIVPSIHEQQQIVEYLDEQTSLIDKTISIEEKRIELLKEYRQSLISEVVTGKRKVVEL